MRMHNKTPVPLSSDQSYSYIIYDMIYVTYGNNITFIIIVTVILLTIEACRHISERGHH